MKKQILTLALLSIVALASAEQTNPPYSLQVKWATQKQSNIPKHAVYIWPWVKTPGAYPYKKGMTLSDLVVAAGGLIKDERYPTMPSEYYPKTISIIRPSQKDTDPTTSIFCIRFDWSVYSEAISNCKFELQEGDFVSISMSPCVP